MIAAYMLKPQDEPNRDGWVMTRYLQAARWCLEHPWKTGGMAAAFFVVSVAIIGLIPATFLPPEDWAQLQMTVESPPGSTIASADSSQSSFHSPSPAARTRRAIVCVPVSPRWPLRPPRRRRLRA